jgi:hypothetical protein
VDDPAAGPQLEPHADREAPAALELPAAMLRQPELHLRLAGGDAKARAA